MPKGTTEKQNLTCTPHLNVGNDQVKRRITDIRMQPTPHLASAVNAHQPVHWATYGLLKRILLSKDVLICTTTCYQMPGKFSQLRAVHRKR